MVAEPSLIRTWPSKSATLPPLNSCCGRDGDNWRPTRPPGSRTSGSLEGGGQFLLLFAVLRARVEGSSLDPNPRNNTLRGRIFWVATPRVVLSRCCTPAKAQGMLLPNHNTASVPSLPNRLSTMPAFNLLSWRRSPRGRPSTKPAHTASAELPSTGQPTNPSTQAARDVFKKPISPPISRLRRAQQALIGRRRRVSNRNSRVRVSFPHSSTSSALHSSGTRNSIIALRHPPKTEEAFTGPGSWTT